MHSLTCLVLIALCTGALALSCYNQVFNIDDKTKPTNTLNCPSGTTDCYRLVTSTRYASGSVADKVTYGCDSTHSCDKRGRKRRDVITGYSSSMSCCNKNNCNNNSGTSIRYLAGMISSAFFIVSRVL